MALFNDQHAVLGGAKVQLPNESGVTQLGSAELLKARDDATACGDGNQLDLRSSNPPGEEKT